MPTAVITITKQRRSIPWVLVADSFAHTGHFTQEELDTIVIPFKNFVKSLPGFLGITEKIINDTTVVIEKRYDTMENLRNAEARLRYDSTEPIAVTKDELMVRKHKELNIYPYTVTTMYNED